MRKVVLNRPHLTYWVNWATPSHVLVQTLRKKGSFSVASACVAGYVIGLLEGLKMLLPRAFCSATLLSAVFTTAGQATTVQAWNDAWLDAIRATGGPPGPIARAGAMVHTAMFNAVNAVQHPYQGYHFNVAAPDALAEVAAAQAGRDVLAALYPTLAGNFDALLASQLSLVPDSAGKTAGIALGQTAAASMLTLRTGDGSDNNTPYIQGNNPGEWRQTDARPPATPNWGLLDPFNMTSGDQFRPDLPGGATNMTELLTSQLYTDNYIDVLEKGALVGSTRTQDETDIGSFWANDRDGTYKPPGHLNDIAQTLATQNGLSLIEEARLFALLNLTLADASIVAWDAKYLTDVDFWRPVTGIQLGDTDGNPNTIGDPYWQPWSNHPDINGFTPPFPAFTSGHATFGAAASAIFREFFGTDAMTFTIGTDDPGYTGPAQRTYQSFMEIALENGRSRVYLGVHWQFDADLGYSSGDALGRFVANNCLAPVPEPLTASGFTLATAAIAMSIRRRRL